MTTTTTTDHKDNNNESSLTKPQEPKKKKQKTSNVIELHVPLGCVPGTDSLSFTYLGNEMEIPVPEGSKEGDVLQIQLGGAANDGDVVCQEDEGEEEQENEREDNDGAEQAVVGPSLYHPHLRSSEGGITKIPLDGDEDDDKNNNSTTSYLTIYDTVPSTTETTDGSTNVTNTDCHNCDNHKEEEKVVEEEEIDNEQDDGTHAMAWPAGRHLANVLSSVHRSPCSSSLLYDTIQKSKTIVELGSGSGLCGLALAIAANRCPLSSLGTISTELLTTEILLTDVPSAMKLLNHNVRSNQHILQLPIPKPTNPTRSSTTPSNGAITNNVVVRTAPLIWGSNNQSIYHALSSFSVSKVDLVLASDVLYDSSMETLRALVSTIRTINDHSNLSDSATASASTTDAGVTKATILLAVRWRKPEEERRFFQEMEKEGYIFELLNFKTTRGNDGAEPSKSGNSGDASATTLGWKEFGNPRCNESNGFFTETYVRVNNVPKALKDVTEEDMDEMNDDEFAVFEELYIQVYLGRRKSE